MANAEINSDNCIRKLSQLVINRIAAGEVVQRPANVVKELIENCLDAGSTQIVVTVKNGGLKFIQVQDNGHGIRVDDLDILCHRFTTSKLRNFEDLQTIATYGFRGEALASVSHVAHLSVVTKVADSQLAYKALYIDGTIQGKPTPCAGNQGTIITIEELFYNMPIRRKALKTPGEEHAKIVDVIAKYALHNTGVGFMLKRQNESTVDVRTTSNSTVEQNIASLFGQALAKDFLPLKVENAVLGFDAEGFISHPSYSGKKFVFVLFINDRLVECSSLKKSLELLFSQVLPKNNHPFMYLKLKIVPRNLDVNVHPTKMEVHFLNENAIIEQIQDAVERKVLACNESRVFYVKNLHGIGNLTKNIETVSNNNTQLLSTSKAKIYDHHLVRTDCKERKLEEFFISSNLEREETVKVNLCVGDDEQSNDGKANQSHLIDISEERFENEFYSDAVTQNCQINVDEKDSPYVDDAKSKHWRVIKLTSVLQLQHEIKENCSPQVRSIIKDHTFVGSVDAKLALIQHKTSLYLVNTTALAEELFYQMLVYRFGNFGVFRLQEPCSLFDLVLLALECKVNKRNADEDKPNAEIAKTVVEVLSEQAAMLWDYFSIEIKDGLLWALPSVHEDYAPQFEGLPTYILRLATKVDWSAEKPCFAAICRETAKFFAIKSEYCVEADSSAAGGPSFKWKWLVESVLYPVMKSKLMPSSELTKNGCILRLTDLHDLYKVFERC